MWPLSKNAYLGSENKVCVLTHTLTHTHTHTKRQSQKLNDFRAPKAKGGGLAEEWHDIKFSGHFNGMTVYRCVNSEMTDGDTQGFPQERSGFTTLINVVRKVSKLFIRNFFWIQ